MNLFGDKKEVVIFDTEYTSWEGSLQRNWSGSNEYKEIVQIGASIITTDDLKEQDSIVIYIKPFKNPILSEYLIKLTGITQEEVDSKGFSFEDGVKKFFDWCEGRDLYCFGVDGVIMKENADLLKWGGFPFEEFRFHDVRELFKKQGINTEGYMSSTIPRAFGIEPRGQGHDALNDARCIVDALVELKIIGIGATL